MLSAEEERLRDELRQKRAQLSVGLALDHQPVAERLVAANDSVPNDTVPFTPRPPSPLADELQLRLSRAGESGWCQA